MAKIETSNSALLPNNIGDSSTQVTFNNGIILKSRTLIYTRRRRPHWVIDLYAIRNTMRVSESPEE